ncbi:hypothetical protein RPN52_20155 [Pseudomonas putida]
MGQAAFANTAAFTVDVDGTPLQLHPVSMGNPHCVVFVDQPTETLARQLGPLIERLSIFPDRTNVQFVRVIDRQTLEVQIWERGSATPFPPAPAVALLRQSRVDLDW